MFLDGCMFPGKAVIPYVDKCGADISNLHRDGRPCSQEDDFWILFFFVYGKIHIKGFLWVKCEPAFIPEKSPASQEWLVVLPGKCPYVRASVRGAKGSLWVNSYQSVRESK